MANDISANPWNLDTTNASAIWKSMIKVEHFEWSGYANATDVIILKDQNGKVVWKAGGTTDKQEVRSGKVGWIDGLIVDTLPSGLCLAYIG